MKYELRHIGVWSAMKIGFLIWGLLGFLLGIYMALMMPVLLSMLGSIGGMPDGIDGMGPLALLVFPFIYSIMGAIIGMIITAIVAGFYNLVSRLTGGIEVDLHGDTVQPLEISDATLPGARDKDISPV